ncbi:uncharacterized protein [Diabrotica undecimpunctata]|uniref:uncharacterized protein n=1 Tax=Diabrotica undecimpunctata TaxID=50387 RepID=UPI003B641801
MDFLLQEIADLIKEARLRKDAKAKQKSTFQHGKEAIDMWANTLENETMPVQNLKIDNDHDYYTVPHDTIDMSDGIQENLQSLEVFSSFSRSDEFELLHQREENDAKHPLRTPKKRNIDEASAISNKNTTTPVNRVLGPRQYKKQKTNSKSGAITVWGELLKRKAQNKEQRKLREVNLEERKIALEQRKMDLEERKVALKAKMWEQQEKRFELVNMPLMYTEGEKRITLDDLNDEEIQEFISNIPSGSEDELEKVSDEDEEPNNIPKPVTNEMLEN